MTSSPRTVVILESVRQSGYFSTRLDNSRTDNNRLGKWNYNNVYVWGHSHERLPGNPVGPVLPIGPVAPVDPAEPVDPVDPVAPVGPRGPDSPAIPDTPKPHKR